MTNTKHSRIAELNDRETSSRLPVFSLFLPGSCPNNRYRRILPVPLVRNSCSKHAPDINLPEFPWDNSAISDITPDS